MPPSTVQQLSLPRTRLKAVEPFCSTYGRRHASGLVRRLSSVCGIDSSTPIDNGLIFLLKVQYIKVPISISIYQISHNKTQAAPQPGYRKTRLGSGQARSSSPVIHPTSHASSSFQFRPSSNAQNDQSPIFDIALLVVYFLLFIYCLFAFVYVFRTLACSLVISRICTLPSLSHHVHRFCTVCNFHASL